MKFVILGPTALDLDGRDVALGAAKQRALLGLLLYYVGQPVRVDTIVEQLWQDRTTASCRVNLYALASRTRAVLNSVGIRDSLVRVKGIGAYRLDIDPHLIDFHQFRHLLSQAREAAKQQQYNTCAELLASGIDLWRDEPLADLRGPRAENLRRQMTDVLLEAHKLLAESRLRAGGHDEVLAQLEPLVHTYDIDETLARHWIAALYAAGRNEDARTFSLAFRRRFRRAMHTEPDIEMAYTAASASLARTGPHTPNRGSGKPSTSPPAPRQLPNDINDFTGHEDLLSELDILTTPDTGATNIVLISGMPGAGKTTLATHWAHQRRHRFPDGQLYLNANAYGPTPPVDPNYALGRFLHTLDVPAHRIPSTADQRRDQLNKILSGRRMLIVLDNVKDSAQVRPLLATSDTCVTLITSRNRLRGLAIRDGVHTLTVPPLADHECLHLLTLTIGKPRAHTESDAVQALARLSGGLPLALRIIGEHVAERPRARVADLVAELSADLLDCEGEDDEEASLRTVFAWSYHALTAEAARLFRVLGLHPAATISPEPAAAMLAIATPTAEQLLNTLAKAHLINHDTARRYRFHDLLRLYATECASQEPATEKAAALRRLMDWYLLTAANAAALLAPQRPPVPDLPQPTDVEPQTFASDTDAMKWCEAERSNLAAITRWAANNGFPRHGWQIPGAIHEILERYGRQDDVLELQKIALSSAQAEGHQIGQIGTLNNLGGTYFALHDHRRAASAIEEALHLAREIQYLDAEAACSHNLASIHLSAGDIETAVRLYTQVLAQWRTRSDPAGEAATLHRLGDAHRQMKQYDQAANYYQQALTIRERIGSLRGQAATHAELAALYLQTAQPLLALAHCHRALEIHHRTRDDAARCDTLITIADAQRELAMHPAAIHNAHNAINISEEITDPQRRSRALTVFADALRASGDIDGAHRTCAEALNTLNGNDPDSRALQDRLLAIRDSIGSPSGSD